MCRGREVRRTVGPLVAAVAVSLAVAPGAQAAKPVHVSCGETITADTTLANDLTNCPGHGLLIGADRIRLDLNGHTVDGDGAGDDAGIYNAAGHDGVTIERGTVRDFSEGVLVQHASGNRVRNLRTSGNRHMGINLGRSARSSIERNASMTDAGGILVSDSRDVTVANNSVSDNQLYAAIPIFASDHVRVTQNTVRRSTMGSPISLLDNSDHNRVESNSISDSADGVFLAEDADHNRVTGNSISDSRFQGIFLGPGSDHNVVSRNSSLRNLDGVVLDGATHNVIAANSLKRNTLTGLFVFNSDDNLIERNTVTDNGAGAEEPEGGIRLFFSEAEDPQSTSDRNLIARNVLARNVLDGVLVNEGNDGTAIDRNRSSENGDDGIDVESPATTLSRNTANDNRDLGIEAVPGVTDGGGNRASSNGNPLQCVNVFCR